MEKDCLSRHRKAVERVESSRFDMWLQSNCTHAISAEEIRNRTNDKVKKIEKILKK